VQIVLLLDIEHFYFTKLSQIPISINVSHNLVRCSVKEIVSLDDQIMVLICLTESVSNVFFSPNREM